MDWFHDFLRGLWGTEGVDRGGLLISELGYPTKYRGSVSRNSKIPIPAPYKIACFSIAVGISSCVKEGVNSIGVEVRFGAGLSKVEPGSKMKDCSDMVIVCPKSPKGSSEGPV